MNRVLQSRRQKRQKTAVLVAAGLVAGWVALTACSNQGEGERCEVGNNSDDCSDGLVCYAAPSLNGYRQGDPDRCCPRDRETATHPSCTVARGPIGGDVETPADTGPGADTSVDAEAGVPDAGVDAADAADAGDADADAGL